MNRLTTRKFFSSLALACSVLLAVTPAHADEEMDKIRASGTLTVGVYDDNPPWSTKTGGIDVDLAEALAKKLNLKLSLMPFPSGENVEDDLRNMVWKGHYLGYGPANVLMHVPVDRMLMQRNDKVEIFAPYHRETVKVAFNSKTVPDYQGVESLAGKRIGAEKVSISAMVLLGDAALRDTVQISKSAIEALEKLKAGELDAVVAARSEIESVLRGAPGFEVAEATFPRLPRSGWVSGMAVKKESAELAKLLMQAMNEMDASGELAKIFAKHGVKYVKPQS